MSESECDSAVCDSVCVSWCAYVHGYSSGCASIACACACVSFSSATGMGRLGGAHLIVVEHFHVRMWVSIVRVNLKDIVGPCGRIGHWHLQLPITGIDVLMTSCHVVVSIVML